ncbi:unnamed protein product [Mytilus coruscus]|uniref:Uncharacterized protein n=1 Tax=Mytilus coruscus TaxID=42192 RepID=A0A6J8E8N2_MYTCO|nr:unnamed protein product [Mytilus coruscus]
MRSLGSNELHLAADAKVGLLGVKSLHDMPTLMHGEGMDIPHKSNHRFNGHASNNNGYGNGGQVRVINLQNNNFGNDQPRISFGNNDKSTQVIHIPHSGYKQGFNTDYSRPREHFIKGNRPQQIHRDFETITNEISRYLSSESHRGNTFNHGDKYGPEFSFRMPLQKDGGGKLILTYGPVDLGPAPVPSSFTGPSVDIPPPEPLQGPVIPGPDFGPGPGFGPGLNAFDGQSNQNWGINAPNFPGPNFANGDQLGPQNVANQDFSIDLSQTGNAWGNQGWSQEQGPSGWEQGWNQQGWNQQGVFPGGGQAGLFPGFGQQGGAPGFNQNQAAAAQQQDFNQPFGNQNLGTGGPLPNIATLNSPENFQSRFLGTGVQAPVEPLGPTMTKSDVNVDTIKPILPGDVAKGPVPLNNAF